jgi:hypothetical protein
MSKSADQVNALQGELCAWMERNGLATDASWQTPDEKRGANPVPPYLVLTSERVYDVVCDWDLDPKIAPPRPDAAQLKREFLALVEQHGFKQDFEMQGPVMYFICIEDSQAEDNRRLAKEDEDHAYMKELEDAGWRREGRCAFVHPDDPVRRIIYDEFEKTFFLSARQVALVEQEIQRRRAAGELTKEKVGRS